MAVAAAEIIPESMSEAMFRSNLEDIKSRFAVLLQSIQAALEANNVTKESVRGVLVGMYPNCEDNVPTTNMGEIFTAASRHKLWDYEHHSPLEKLVRRLLGSDHLSEVREYKAHLSGFYATVKLIDYIKYKNIDPTLEKNELKLEEFTVTHFQELMVKLELNRKIDKLSLKYIQDLWEEFAEEFDIPFLTAVVDKVMSGSLEIVWLISPDVAEKIASSANEAIWFYQEHHIVYLAIDNSPVYDELKVEGCLEDLTCRLKKGISQYCEKQGLDVASVTNQDVKTLVDKHVNIDHVEHDSVTNKLSYVVSVKSDASFRCARSSDRSTMETETASGQDRETERLASLPFAGLFYGFFAGLVAMLFIQEWFNCIIAAILAGALAAVITVPIIVHNIWQVEYLNMYLLKGLLPIFFATFVLFVIPSVAVAAVVAVADRFYTRATLAGVITSAIGGEFNTQAVRALLGVAETNNLAYILVLYFALLLGVLGVIDVASIVGAFLGAYIGTIVYQELIGRLNAVIGALPGEIWGTVVYKRAINRYLAYGVCSGAIIGALGIVNGAITGAIMGAIMAKPGGIDTRTYFMHVSKSCFTYPLLGTDQFELFETCGSIHPYSIADRVIVGAIRVVIIILRPITNITNTIIRSQSVASEVILGAIFGAIIGAFAGVTGGAFTGVIVAGLILGSYYCLGVTMAGESVLLIGERAPSVRHEIGRDAGRAIDKNCCLIFVGILCTALSSVIGAYAGGYFIASALSGEFGSAISWLIGCVVALFKIGNSALTGGLVGIFLGIKVYRTFVKAVSDDMTVQIFVFGFGIGAISGALMTIGDTLWQIFWMPMYIGGATLGAISGSFVGFIAKVIIMEKLADIAIANVGGIVGTTSAMIGGFVGAFMGVYFTSSVIFTGLSGITLSTISIAILTVIRQCQIKRSINIPLNDIIATFGAVTKSNINQDRGGRWIQYKVNCHYVVPR